MQKIKIVETDNTVRVIDLKENQYIEIHDKNGRTVLYIMEYHDPFNSPFIHYYIKSLEVL